MSVPSSRNATSDLDLNKYCDVMEEIKRRTSVVDALLSGKTHALYEQTTIESFCLQIRKILELVAMASLVANEDSLSRAQNSLRKEWHADKILREIERANPDFYPSPIVEHPQSGPIAANWEERTGDVLTREEFAEIYGRCGTILHAGNPLGAGIDYSYYKTNAPRWMKKTMNLLNSHTIRLVDNPNLYLIHMKEEGNDNVRGYIFAPLGPTSSAHII